MGGTHTDLKCQGSAMQHGGFSCEKSFRLRPSAPPPNQQTIVTGDKWTKLEPGASTCCNPPRGRKPESGGRAVLRLLPERLCEQRVLGERAHVLQPRLLEAGLGFLQGQLGLAECGFEQPHN